MQTVQEKNIGKSEGCKHRRFEGAVQKADVGKERRVTYELEQAMSNSPSFLHLFYFSFCGKVGFG